MTLIMSPVLTTLKTDDINRLNNARSHTDCAPGINTEPYCPNVSFPQVITSNNNEMATLKAIKCVVDVIHG